MKKKLNIVITGGHVTPALATLEVLQKRGHTVLWFGEKRAHEGKNASTLEYQIIPHMGIPFFQIYSAKFHRRNLGKTLLGIWKLPLGVLQSLFLLLRIRPDVVLCFGSYLAVPVSFSAYLLGIPVVTHEQTASFGLANRIVGSIAKKVAITFPVSRSLFSKEKVVITGNPIRESIFTIARERKKRKLGRRKVLYITGGSRGSHAINLAVLPVLPALLKTFSVIHQCGLLEYPMCQQYVHTLGASAKHYTVSANYSSSQVDEIFAKADLVVSRAGANTVLELAALGIPSLFIPIPWSGGDEQLKNAQSMVDAGIASILPESEVSPQSLLREIEYMASHISDFLQGASRAKELASPRAAEQVATITEEVAR